VRAGALVAVGQMAWRSADYPLARTRIDAALALAASFADPLLEARALRLRSVVNLSDGCADAAADDAQRTVEIYDACGDGLGGAGALVSRAWARYAQGDADAGNDDMRAALETNEPFRNATITAYGHYGLAFGALLSGDDEGMRTHLACAATGIDDGGVVERSDWLGLAALLAARQGRPHATVRLLGGMDTWERRRGGSKLPAELAAPFMPLIEKVFLQVGSPLGDRLWARGRQLGWDELVAEALEQQSSPSPLTPRETEIAELVAEGLTNADIARRLVLSRRTVESHVDHIKQKLMLNGRNEIIVWVLRESPESKRSQNT